MSPLTAADADQEFQVRIAFVQFMTGFAEDVAGHAVVLTDPDLLRQSSPEVRSKHASPPTGDHSLGALNRAIADKEAAGLRGQAVHDAIREQFGPRVHNNAASQMERAKNYAMNARIGSKTPGSPYDKWRSERLASATAAIPSADQAAPSAPAA